MTRWLVTGAAGMLGRDLVELLGPERLTAATRADVDITDPDAVLHAVGAAVGPGDIVLNAAAWTDVDGAEAHHDAAYQVNAVGVGHLAAACKAVGARLIHVSTDYVFDGRGHRGRSGEPYPEDAPTSPVNNYGRGKLAGEQAVLRTLPDTGWVVRTAWLYGRHGNCFPRTMLRLAPDRATLDVVDDQRGAPTWSRALAGQLIALGRSAAPAGIYHGTAGGVTTWYGFARALFAELGMDPDRIRATDSGSFRRPAPRPADSVLGHDRWAAAGVAALPDWRPMLREAVAAGTFRADRSEPLSRLPARTAPRPGSWPGSTGPA